MYAYVRHTEGGDFDLFVADVGSDLKAALAAEWEAAVYGINFDFDKATRPDSEPTLTRVLRLRREEAKLAVEIGGHTNNVGKLDYDMKVSDQRAAAFASGSSHMGSPPAG